MLADFAPMRVPAVLILNMMDVAKLQGKSIDTESLSKRLGITVVPFVAADRKKYPELKDILRSEFNNPKKIDTEKLDALCGGAKSEMELANARFQWIEALLDGVVTGEKKRAALSKADRIFTSRRWGKPFSVAVMLLAFVASMIMAVPLMGLGSFIPRLASPLLHRLMQAGHAAPFLESLAADLIPNVVYFAAAMAGFVVGVTFTFTALEETGFLARISYAFDGTMTKLGLQGKSICPMLMGLGCTIGGAAGARVIDNWDDTVNAGIEKVRDFIASLAKDDNSARLVNVINRLLKKDAKGNLKASRVLELTKLAQEFNSPAFTDAVGIIAQSYRPQRSAFYIEANTIDEQGKKCNIPLSLSSVDFPPGTDIKHLFPVHEKYEEQATA